MFSPEEKATMAQIASILENAGYATYLPQRDGIEVARVMKLINTPLVEITLAEPLTQLVRKAVFCLDMYQVLIRCESLVFNMDGRVPDEGSVVETTAGFTAGKPLVIYKNDPITMLNGQDNPMISGLSYTFKTIDDINKIPDELKSVTAKVLAAGPNPFVENMPPFVRDVTKFGNDVWNFLQTFRLFEAKEEDFLDFLKKLVKFGQESIVFNRIHWH